MPWAPPFYPQPTLFVFPRGRKHGKETRLGGGQSVVLFSASNLIVTLKAALLLVTRVRKCQYSHAIEKHSEQHTERAESASHYILLDGKIPLFVYTVRTHELTSLELLQLPLDLVQPLLPPLLL